MSRITTALALSLFLACESKPALVVPPPPAANATKTASGLVYEDRAPGAGAEAKAGDKVAVHYTGWLQSGMQFDSSRGREPLEFSLGAGNVIKGWDEGVAGLKVGGQRRLFIPPELGYGSRGAPPVIPGGATLIFDVELVAIR
ncbi:MAG: FKBP-type peptidyl-prolyl cis-trans isomerase [Myxococcota bacterium]